MGSSLRREEQEPDPKQMEKIIRLEKRREENTGGLFIIPDDGLLSHPWFWGAFSPPSIMIFGFFRYS